MKKLALVAAMLLAAGAYGPAGMALAQSSGSTPSSDKSQSKPRKGPAGAGTGQSEPAGQQGASERRGTGTGSTSSGDKGNPGGTRTTGGQPEPATDSTGAGETKAEGDPGRRQVRKDRKADEQQPKGQEAEKAASGGKAKPAPKRSGTRSDHSIRR